MPLHIIIDGYNLIGSAAGLRGNLERSRVRLIDDLRRYQNRKGCPITKVIRGAFQDAKEESGKDCENFELIYLDMSTSAL